MRLLLLLLLTLTAGRTAAQATYPQGLFRNPLRIPILLAGNFGECRPGHFHSGIDIKTGGKENEPVYAAAAGYVARIKMEPGGFGHALYVTHPEGYTTLYAHLNDFSPVLQRFTRAAQYGREQWELDTMLPPDLFPVRQGEQIAWSGNTGGSTAPHLHFEIRDSKTEHPLNPQLFGLPIRDSRPPVVKALYLYDPGRSLYDQQPKAVALKKRGDSYVPAGGDTLAVRPGYAGVGFSVDDYADGSENTLAPYTFAWTTDGAPAGTITLDDIGYEETRYLHAYADYKTKWNNGPWVQLLFRLPGNALARLYEFARPGDGALPVGDAPVPVVTTIRDAAGNESTVSFWLRGSLSPDAARCADRWLPQTPLRWAGPNLQIQGGAEALYDSLCIQTRPTTATGAFSEAFAVGRPEVPLHTALSVAIKPNRPVPFALRSKLALLCDDGKSRSGRAAIAEEGGWYRAACRSFGTFSLVPDTVAPRISPLRKTGTGLQYTVTDATTRVISVRGTVDGRWVLFEQHGSTWTYRFDDRCPPGRHVLVLAATDDLGNTARTAATVTR